MVDIAARKAQGKVAPTRRIDDSPVVGYFLRDYPPKWTQSQTDFYEAAKQAEEAQKSFDKLRQEGKSGSGIAVFRGKQRHAGGLQAHAERPQAVVHHPKEPGYH